MDASGEQKHKGDGEAVGSHEHDGGTGPQGRAGGDAEETIAHVHDGRVTDHALKVRLGHGDEADEEHVAQGQPDQELTPVGGTRRQKRNRNLHKTVETELLEDARMEHGNRGGGGSITARSPCVKWE